MRRGLVKKYWLILALCSWVFTSLAPGVAVSAADLPSEARMQAIKASYLFNLLANADWPASYLAGGNNAQTPYRIGILGDRPVAVVTRTIAKTKTIAGRKVEVVEFTEASEVQPTHVLFIASSFTDQTPEILGKLRSSSAVLVGESEGFAEKWGVLNFVLQEGSLRWELNPHHAARIGVEISKKLRDLSVRVIE